MKPKSSGRRADASRITSYGQQACRAYADQADRLRGELKKTDQAIADLSVSLDALLADVDDVDLAYL